jgi:hypothetical protein
MFLRVIEAYSNYVSCMMIKMKKIASNKLLTNVKLVCLNSPPPSRANFIGELILKE